MAAVERPILAERTTLYSPLIASNRQIRLLQLRDAEGAGELIRGSLSTHCIDAVPFVALSYAWGPESQSCRINIDGHAVFISKNLHDFLTSCMQRDDRPQKLWIDQLCINQHNAQERSEQVAMMAEIYNIAEQTIMWLGPGFEGSDHALRVVARSHKIGAILPERDRRTLQLFLELPYWMRLWVTQEILLSRNVMVWLGSAFLAWRAIDQSIINTPTRQLESRTAIESLRRVGQLLRKSQVTYLDEIYRLSWSLLLPLSAGTQCRELHDQIYGHLGVVKPKYRVPARYDISILELYHAVVEKEVVVDFPEDGLDMKVVEGQADFMWKLYQRLQLVRTAGLEPFQRALDRQLLKAWQLEESQSSKGMERTKLKLWMKWYIWRNVKVEKT